MFKNNLFILIFTLFSLPSFANHADLKISGYNCSNVNLEEIFRKSRGEFFRARYFRIKVKMDYENDICIVKQINSDHEEIVLGERNNINYDKDKRFWIITKDNDGIPTTEIEIKLDALEKITWAKATIRIDGENKKSEYIENLLLKCEAILTK